MSNNIIKLTEQDLHNIINESIKNVLSELDWRTYSTAADKAVKASCSRDIDLYEKQRKKNQANSFSKASEEALEKKFNLQDFDSHRINDPSHIPSQGDLRRASKRQKEVSDFRNNKTHYVKGKGWINTSKDEE